MIPVWSDIFSLSGQTLLLRLVAIAILIAFHGWTLALFARFLGDDGPKHDGRLSLNPLNHFEFVGAFAALLFRFGWIKPMTLDTKALRGGTFGALAVALAGLIALIALAFALSQLRPLLLAAFPGGTIAIAAIAVIEMTVTMAVRYALFNIVPLPPLTGGIVLAAFAPRLHEALTRRPFLMTFAMGVIVIVGLPEFIFGKMTRALIDLIV